MFTVKARLKELRKDFGGYIMYVFEVLDENITEKTWYAHYITTVRFPNWEEPPVDVGDVGYLDFKDVLAGKDTWWDKSTNTFVPYNYDHRIFIRFIRERSTDFTVTL